MQDIFISDHAVNRSFIKYNLLLRAKQKNKKKTKKGGGGGGGGGRGSLSPSSQKLSHASFWSDCHVELCRLEECAIIRV